MNFRSPSFPILLGIKRKSGLKPSIPLKKGPCFRGLAKKIWPAGPRHKWKTHRATTLRIAPKSKTDPVHHMGRDLRLSRPSPRPSSDSGFKIPGSAHGDGMRSCPKACPPANPWAYCDDLKPGHHSSSTGAWRGPRKGSRCSSPSGRGANGGTGGKIGTCPRERGDYGSTLAPNRSPGSQGPAGACHSPRLPH